MLQLSNTKIKMYQLCPFRYKCYCDPQIKNAYKRESPVLTQGQLIHGVMNSYYKELSPEKRNLESLRELYKEKFLVNKEKHFKIFGDQDRINYFVLQSQKQFKNFLKSSFSKTEPFEVTEKLFEGVVDDIKLCAKIDRIDKEDNGFHIIDYKTGQLREEEPDNFQLNFYAFLVEDKYQKPVVKKSYFYLSEGKTIEIPASEDDREKTLLVIKETASRIGADNNFEARKNFECGFCDYKPLCPLRRA